MPYSQNISDRKMNKKYLAVWTDLNCFENQLDCSNLIPNYLNASLTAQQPITKLARNNDTNYTKTQTTNQQKLDL